VDALTNVVIAMIFVVVALAISLTFAAQLMGKKLAERLVQEHAAKAAASAAAAPLPADGETTALAGRTLIAVAGREAAASAAPVRVRGDNRVLQLNYAPGALSLDDAAAQRLRAALQPVLGDAVRRRVELVGLGPQMSSSDNQRAAYVRLMAVRNQLLELGFVPEQIQVRIDAEREVSPAQVRLVIKEQ
jgi:hypothetical protein